MRVNVSVGGEKHVVDGSHLLLAAGRKPTTSDLGLEAAGIRHDKRGITVNARPEDLEPARLRHRRRHRRAARTPTSPTTMPASSSAARCSAAGQGRPALVPRVTYTDPELAHVGLTESRPRSAPARSTCCAGPTTRTTGPRPSATTDGHIKVVTSRERPDPRRRHRRRRRRRADPDVVARHLAGPQIKAMTEWIAPYPTLCGDQQPRRLRYYATAPTNPFVRKIINFLASSAKGPAARGSACSAPTRTSRGRSTLARCVGRDCAFPHAAPRAYRTNLARPRPAREAADAHGRLRDAGRGPDLPALDRELSA